MSAVLFAKKKPQDNGSYKKEARTFMNVIGSSPLDSTQSEQAVMYFADGRARQGPYALYKQRAHAHLQVVSML